MTLFRMFVNASKLCFGILSCLSFFVAIILINSYYSKLYIAFAQKSDSSLFFVLELKNLITTFTVN